jgi:uncharacterized protein with NRDE domain
MCIIIIKKSNSTNYSHFIGLNRDENYEKKWEGISNHWSEYPFTFGYKDLNTSGTWFAFNQYVMAITINKEGENIKNLESRSFLALESLKNAENTNEAINNLLNIDTSKIKPFNLVLISRDNIKYATNYYDKHLTIKIKYFDVDKNLILLNRSLPNDFKEKRLSCNFNKIISIKEPIPEKNNWKEWEDVLKEECFVNNKDQETTLWLNSNTWGTLISDIIAVTRDKNVPFIIHNVKTKLI